MKIAAEWGIKKKVFAAVTDNGANVVLVVMDAASQVGTGWTYVLCFAHTLNLMWGLGIFSAFFRHSVVATDKLGQVQISIDNFCTKKIKP
jgi:hypothetical protein